jgi:hypothetical protein
MNKPDTPYIKFAKYLAGLDPKKTISAKQETEMWSCMTNALVGVFMLVLASGLVYVASTDPSAVTNRMYIYSLLIIAPILVAAYMMVPTFGAKPSGTKSSGYAIVVCALLVVAYFLMKNMSMKEIVYANYFIITLGIVLAICLMVIMSKVSVRYLMSLEGWTGFVAKLILYMPCLISELVIGSIDAMTNIYAKIGLILVYVFAFLTIVYYIVDAFASTELLRFGNTINSWIKGNVIDQIIHIESTIETDITDAGNTVANESIKAGNTVANESTNVAKIVETGATNAWNTVETGAINAGKIVETGAINAGKIVETGATNAWNTVETGATNAWNTVETGAINAGNIVETGAINAGNIVANESIKVGNTVANESIKVGNTVSDNIENFSSGETLNRITDMFRIPDWFKQRAYMKSLYKADAFALNITKTLDITGLDAGELGGGDESSRAKNYTISAWVYLPAQAPNTRILSLRKASDAATKTKGTPSVMCSSDKLTITLTNWEETPPSNPPKSPLIKTVDILPQRWNHLVFVYSDNVAHFYLNSKLMFSEPLTNYLPTYSFSDELVSGDETGIIGKIGGVSYVPTTYSAHQISGIYNATRGFYV